MKFAKIKFNPLPEWVKQSIKHGFRDWFFAVILGLFIVLGAAGYFWGKEYSGLIFWFLSLPVFIAIVRGGYWIWLYKRDIGNGPVQKDNVD